MKIVKSTKNLNFNLALNGTMQTVIYGVLQGQYFDGQTNRLEVNWQYLYKLEDGTTVLLKQGAKVLGSQAEINGLFDMVEPMRTITFEEDFSGALNECFYLGLILEMYQIFKPMNPTLEVSDFVIEEVE